MNDEEELRALVAASSGAWVDQDVEKLTTEGGSLVGYGYRVRDARMDAPEARRAGLAAAFASYDYFRIVDHDVNVLVDVDTAVVWGAFTEEFQNTGLPPEVVRSASATRRSNATVSGGSSGATATPKPSTRTAATSDATPEPYGARPAGNWCPISDADRLHPANLVRHHGLSFLVDSGSGDSQRLREAGATEAAIDALYGLRCRR